MLADGSGVPEALWGAACVVIHMCVYLGLQQRSLRTASRALQKRSANSDKQSEHVNIFLKGDCGGLSPPSPKTAPVVAALTFMRSAHSGGTGGPELPI